MGMHFGLVAVRGSVSRLKEEFVRVWPDLEIVFEASGFSSSDDLWAWRDQHEKFVAAADWSKEHPGSQVLFFYQDAEWALLLDTSYVLAGDDEALKSLSAAFGTALAFVVETASGCAMFWCYESGSLRRKIESVDAVINRLGLPLPQELGLGDNYYMDETEKLMTAFGLSLPAVLPVPQVTEAVEVIDRKDYGTLIQKWADAEPKIATSDGKDAKHSWWKFW